MVLVFKTMSNLNYLKHTGENSWTFRLLDERNILTRRLSVRGFYMAESLLHNNRKAVQRKISIWGWGGNYESFKLG